jgi:hypothetical protein
MSLSKENINLVRAAAKSAGDHLIGKLPPHPWLRERNSYAHVWERLRSQLGKSYKDCDDKNLLEILNMIEECKNNPS